MTDRMSKANEAAINKHCQPEIKMLANLKGKDVVNQMRDYLNMVMHLLLQLANARKELATKSTAVADSERLKFMVTERLSCAEWGRNGTERFFSITNDDDEQIAEGSTYRKAIDNAIAALEKSRS